MNRQQHQEVKQKAIFLDRDGVLNRDTGYVYRVDDLEILPGVGEGLAKLHDAGFLFFVVTNQSGVARGMFSLSDAMKFNEALAKKLRDEFQMNIEAFFVCPHHPDGTVAKYAVKCQCRKPENHFVLSALKDYQIDATKSFFIGDRDSDIECGVRSGLKTILIENPEMKNQVGKSKPDFVIKDFSELSLVHDTGI